MKTFISPLRISYFGLFILTAFLCLVSYDTQAQKCSLPKPANIIVTAVQSCNATVAWDPIPDAAYFRVKYKKQGTSVWSPKMNIGAVNSYTFTGLDPSTKYTFSVEACCSNDKSSGNRTTTGTTAACGSPTITSVQTLGDNSVSISWDGCSSGVNQIRYRVVPQPWTYASCGTNQNIALDHLPTNSTYVFQVNSCTDTTGKWSAPGTFTLQSSVVTKPNILVIILDDARYDSYSCNGAPEFFQTPNIDRIAQEGVNFKTSFCVESYCTPSRGSIVTGLYPHNHGAIDNSSNIYPNLPTTASILDSAGYTTAWIGKYHMAVTPQKGYDYWFATKVNTGTDEYNNMKYDYNGILKTVNGHDTDILTDTLLSFLDKNSDTTFFATLAYHAPHNPFIPQNQFSGIYSGENIPVPDDLQRYTENYPSCVYKLTNKHYIDPSDVETSYEKYYELMAGVDAGIGKVLQKLSDLGILNNTCIIFTSDNGFMLGEHGFFMKQLAYDPSSRVPMFIRYPAWFADSTLVTDQMALNIDIAPTILEVAGIQGNYSFDGVSMKKLADHSLNRTSMYYEYIHSASSDNLPYIRGVRTFDSKLTTYGCDQSVQEFFDLDSDMEENTNLIFEPQYAATIASLSSQMDDFRDQYHDIIESLVTCNFSNLKLRDENGADMDGENLPYLDENLTLFPNPASDQLNIAFTSENENDNATVIISDMLGSQLISEKIKIVKGINLFEMKLDNQFSEGTYMLTVISNDVRTAHPFLVQK